MSIYHIVELHPVGMDSDQLVYVFPSSVSFGGENIYFSVGWQNILLECSVIALVTGMKASRFLFLSYVKLIKWID